MRHAGQCSIRQEVRKEFRDEVIKEVKVQAKEEKWGIPAAAAVADQRIQAVRRYAPALRERHVRLRQPAEQLLFEWLLVNKEGGITHVNDTLLNTAVDRQRYRMRWRLALDSQITEGLQAIQPCCRPCARRRTCCAS